MAFEKPLPEWNAPGIEPPTDLKASGWKAGTKPPDEYFNWLQHTAFQALKELQEKAQSKDDVVAIPDASLTQKGIVQLSNSTDSASNTEAATPNAVKQVNDALNELTVSTGNGSRTSFQKVKSGKDAEGVFTVVEYRRKSDQTLAGRAVLSGGISPKYTTRTITYFAADGMTIERTETFALTYDADGELISEV